MFNFIKILFFSIILEINTKLIKVIFLNRHGARTIKDNISHQLCKLYGENMKLSINGLKQHKILGSLSRERYINEKNFIEHKYSPSQFEIISTQYQRTIFSAEGFILGFYPGSLFEVKFDNQNDFPQVNEEIFFINNFNQNNVNNIIPIRIISPQNDTIFHANKCKLGNTYISKLNDDLDIKNVFEISDEEIKKYINELAKFLEVENDIDQNLKPLKKLQFLRKVIQSHMFHLNKKWSELSKGAKHLIRKAVINKFYKQKNKAIEEQKKLKISVLFKTILKKFDLCLKENYFIHRKEPKITVYSVHDSNILDFLQNIISYQSLYDKLEKSLDNDDLYNFLIPHFASNIVIELHRDDENNNYFVQIFYDGNLLMKDFSFIRSEFTQGKIPLDIFRKILEHNIHKKTDEIDCSKVLVKDKKNY